MSQTFDSTPSPGSPEPENRNELERRQFVDTILAQMDETLRSALLPGGRDDFIIVSAKTPDLIDEAIRLPATFPNLSSPRVFDLEFVDEEDDIAQKLGFVGHFSPGPHQLGGARPPLGETVAELRRVLNEHTAPDICGEHRTRADELRAAIRARDGARVLDALDAFGNAKTSGYWGDPAVQALEGRCFRETRAVHAALSTMPSLPWGELDQV